MEDHAESPRQDAIEFGDAADCSMLPYAAESLTCATPFSKLRATVFIDSEADDCAVLAQLRDDLAALGFSVGPDLHLQTILEGSAHIAGDGLVLVNAPNPDVAMLAALTKLDAKFAHAPAAIVVATSLDGLAPVFGTLSQSGAQILVSPRRADWLVACGQALARLPGRAGGQHALHDISSEDRLLILRLSEQLESIAGRLDGVSNAGPAWPQSHAMVGGAMIRGDQPDDPSAFAFNAPRTGFRGQRIAASSGDTLVNKKNRNGQEASSGIPAAHDLRRILRHRQQRGRLFGAELFADPAWDMLLDLAAAHQDGQSVSVTSLCIASGVPPTTALRWIGLMSEAGLVSREEDPADRRRAFLRLTEQSLQALRRYFEDYGWLD